MTLLNETVREQLREILGGVAEPVELRFHGRPDDEASAFMRSLLEELRAVVPAVRIRDLPEAPPLEPGHPSGMAVEGPVLAVESALHPGPRVRFLGLTAGLEFTTLVEAIRRAGDGRSDLSAATLTALGRLDGDVHIQVFTTPSCPYCPQAVRLAHEMAFASERIVADMVDATTFQGLAGKYGVMGVPAQYFNGGLPQVGLASEASIVERVAQAARLVHA